MATNGERDKAGEDVGLANRLRGLRGFRGWNQARAAAEIGIAVNTLGNLERGAEPTVETLVKLSKAFGVSMDWLVRGEEHATAA